MSLICPPFAKQMAQRMPTRGRYGMGWPQGAVVHYTAGRDGAENTIKGGIKNGYAYWCIERDGDIFAAHDADKWGWHCGESRWAKFAKKLVGSCNDDLIGIEMNAAGTVTPAGNGTYKTYFGTFLSGTEVRHVATVPKGQEQYPAPGYYHVYTKEQEETLIKTLLWLKAQRPNVFDFDFVLGHDEVSGLKGLGRWRKTDPGGALSVPMPQFRELLKARWADHSKGITLT